MSQLWGGGGSYQAWTDHLERWSRGERLDAGSLPTLAPEDFTASTWERFRTRLTDALSSRLQGWADALTAAMRAEGSSEFAVGRALAQAREGLSAARALSTHPGLPEDLRDRLRRLVDQQVERLQQDLEHDVLRDAETATDPRTAEARLRTLRDNPLTAVLAEEPVWPSSATNWSFDPAAPPRRRVILP
jgi:hypothetical protein